MDADGHVASMNPAAEELTGMSFSVARGRPHRQVLGGARWLSDLLDAALGEQPRSVRAEGEILGLARRPVSVRASASPLFDGTRPIGAALLLQDLTLARSLESDERRDERLEELGILVAGLAHEIRNPLGGIRGAVQLLASDLAPDASGREYVTLVLREVDRLTKLLNGLLQLRSRGRAPAAAVNVHQVLDHVLAVQREDFAATGTRALRHFDPSLPAVRGDADALIQLFLNLVRNALQAVSELPEGRRREVAITTRLETDFHLSSSRERDRARARLLRIEVSDTGPGIPKAIQATVFSPFVTTRPRGSGLGLAIAHRIVADHEGTIRFETAPGRTVFRVILPVWEEP